MREIIKDAKLCYSHVKVDSMRDKTDLDLRKNLFHKLYLKPNKRLEGKLKDNIINT